MSTVTPAVVAVVVVAAAVVVAGAGWVGHGSRTAPRSGGVAPPGPAPSRTATSPSDRPPVPVTVLVVAGLAPMVVVAAAAGPVVSVLVVGAVAAGRALQIRAVRRARRAAVETAVPDLVDLFVLAAAAGHPVPQCLERVADRAPVAVRPALISARDRLAGGEPLAGALDPLRTALGDLGPHLIDALVAGFRTGAPIAPTLDQVARAARDRRRRTAEHQARRLPVTLLFPLVGCVLPAFGLLAVVPLLVASLGSLSA